MSSQFVVKEMKSGAITLGSVVAKPSVIQWSDIDELKHHNRGANEKLEKLDELIKSIKGRKGYVTPAKGYVEDGKLKLTAGSRRLRAGQELESQGEVYPLPVVLIKKPSTAEEIAEAIADNLSDNNFRDADSPEVLHASFRTLRDLGMGLVAIGEATGFSHTRVNHLLRTFEIPVLKKAILDGKISDRAASDFLTDNYKKVGKDGKPVTEIVEVKDEETGKKKKVRKAVYDEEKIKSALSSAISAAQSTGKGKVGTTTVQRTNADNAPKAPGIRAVKIILDEPEDNVPALFRLYNRWIVGDISEAALKKAFKQNGVLDEMEWLFEIEFDADKRKAAADKAKADKAAKKATTAKATKKANPMAEEDEEIEEDYV